MKKITKKDVKEWQDHAKSVQDATLKNAKTITYSKFIVMITKKTFPVETPEGAITKTVTEYRFLGILLLRKELLMPASSGKEYIYRI